MPRRGGRSDKRAGSGRFKLTGKFVQPVRLDFRQFVYDAPNAATKNFKPSITFTTVEEDNISPLFGDTMYTATFPNGSSFDMMATFGPTGLCGLCGNIGAAADTSPVRRACTMNSRNVRYDLQDSVGVFDVHANTWFKEHGLYDKNIQTDMVRFTYFDVIGSTNDTEVVSTSSSATASNFTGNSTIERLLGVNLAGTVDSTGYKEATTTPPCIGDIQAAVVPYCEMDTRLFHRAVKDSPPCSGKIRPTRRRARIRGGATTFA